MLLTHSAAAPVRSTVPGKYRSARIYDLEPLMRSQIAHAGDKGRGFVFTGPTGRGKTHALAAIANDDNGGEGFVAWNDFLSTIREWWNMKGDDAARFNPAKWAARVPMLFLDDVGNEITNGARTNPNADLGLEQFPLLVNARYNAGLPISLTTNMTPDELRARYGERTISRLVESCEWIAFGGVDRRIGA